jgi:endonuclease YncB( thermonuclease family)
MWDYNVALVRVIDGDTYVLDIDQGFSNHTIQHVRLRGIDCPEASTSAGRAATAFATSWWASRGGRAVIVTSKTQTKTFDRYVADISAPYAAPFIGDHESLAVALRLAGHFKAVESLG